RADGQLMSLSRTISKILQKHLDREGTGKALGEALTTVGFSLTKLRKEEKPKEKQTTPRTLYEMSERPNGQKPTSTADNRHPEVQDSNQRLEEKLTSDYSPSR